MSLYQFDFTNPTLSIGLCRCDNNIELLFHTGNEWFYVDGSYIDQIIDFLQESSEIKDLKQLDKTIVLEEGLEIRRVLEKTSPDLFIIWIRQKIQGAYKTVILKGKEQRERVLTALQLLKLKHASEIELEQIRGVLEEEVQVKGQRFAVNNEGHLQLHSLGILHVSDIDGISNLKTLTNLSLYDNDIERVEEDLSGLSHLKVLNLSKNRIQSIKNLKGLIQLIYLEELYLGTNPISDFSGLERLGKLPFLKRVYIDETLIPKELFQQYKVNPSNVVSAVKLLREQHQQQKMGKRIAKESTEKAKKYLRKASQIYEELSYQKIMSKTGVELKDLEDIVEDLIMEGKIHAKIKRDGIVFLEENPLVGLTLEAIDHLKDIKDNTELISQYTSYIENIFDQMENVEEILRNNLASDFEKIKYAWQDYKDGKIEKKELIKTGIKVIGKKFVKIFIK